MDIQNTGMREAGLVVIGISIVLLFLMASITDQLNHSLDSACACEAGSCPMTGNLPVQSYAGFTVTVVLLGFGSFLMVKSRRMNRANMEKEKEMKVTIKSMNPDESRLYDIVRESGNVIFQSEIIEKAGFSKVKVSRILDRLEARGLIERRRRGMTNVVIMKH